jgi:hypothetical protein
MSESLRQRADVGDRFNRPEHRDALHLVRGEVQLLEFHLAQVEVVVGAEVEHPVGQVAKGGPLCGLAGGHLPCCRLALGQRLDHHAVDDVEVVHDVLGQVQSPPRVRLPVGEPGQGGQADETTRWGQVPRKAEHSGAVACRAHGDAGLLERLRPEVLEAYVLAKVCHLPGEAGGVGHDAERVVVNAQGALLVLDNLAVALRVARVEMERRAERRRPGHAVGNGLQLRQLTLDVRHTVQVSENPVGDQRPGERLRPLARVPLLPFHVHLEPEPADRHPLLVHPFVHAELLPELRHADIPIPGLPGRPRLVVGRGADDLPVARHDYEVVLEIGDELHRSPGDDGAVHRLQPEHHTGVRRVFDHDAGQHGNDEKNGFPVHGDLLM